MEAVVEVVIVTLGVKVHHCGLAESTWFWFIHHYILYWHDVLKELLEIFPAYFQVQVTQKTFINEISFDKLLHSSTRSQDQVCCP